MHFENLQPTACIPDYRFRNTEEALQYLIEEENVEGVISDLDGVLEKITGNHAEFHGNIEKEVYNKFQKVADEHGACIVTNRVNHVSDFEISQKPEIKDFYGVPVVTGRDVNGDEYSKPDEEIYRKAMQELGVENPENAYMIGDSGYSDIYGAKKAGMQTIQVQQDGENGFWFLNGPRSRYDTKVHLGKIAEDAVQSTVISANKIWDRI